MEKALRILLRCVVVIFCLAIVLFAVIFATRTYNENKYRSYQVEGPAAADPTDLSAYDTDVKGVEVTRVVGDYLNGFSLRPDDKRHQGIIVTFGGSEGSPAYESARFLADQGYEVLSLFYFGMDNQTPDLVHVPLEFFEEVLAYIDDHIEDGEAITLYGSSKGAELALNLATYYPQVDHLVLWSPAAWNYMGLSNDFSQEMMSSWTYGGEEVAYIDMTKGNIGDGLNLILDFVLNRPVNYRAGYESATLNDPYSEAARIKVEQTNADILIFAGGDDQLWHSDLSAQTIKEKRPENTEVHLYEEAGHIFELDRYLTVGGLTIELGGQLEANQQAAQASREILLDRLSQWHE